jgi:hypothetical protein
MNRAAATRAPLRFSPPSRKLTTHRAPPPQVNKFGWNATFCCLDADKDGQTNGFELGDPCCVWTANATPAFTTDISHPGIPSSTTQRAAPACMATACPKAQ